MKRAEKCFSEKYSSVAPGGSGQIRSGKQHRWGKTSRRIAKGISRQEIQIKPWSPNDRGTAAVHIFRFQGDRVIELWDVGQPVPENSPNENGMF